MTNDELEFSVSQYLDGTLPADERVALEARLASDTEARAVLEEYRELTAALRRVPALDPPPAVRWDQFAERISLAVAEQDRLETEQESRRYRIGGWRRVVAPLAVAASVLVAAAVGWRVYMGETKPDGLGQVVKKIEVIQPAPAPPETIVIVATGETPSEVAVNSEPIQVAVGPAPAAESDPGLPRYAGVVARPSRVTIASSLAAAQDASSAGPF